MDSLVEWPLPGTLLCVAEGAPHLRGQFSCFFLVSWFAFSWWEPGFHIGNPIWKLRVLISLYAALCYSLGVWTSHSARCCSSRPPSDSSLDVPGS